jgi:hypothetical protein
VSEIKPGDLLAAQDVIDALAEHSDTLSLEQAIQMMEILANLTSVVRRADQLVQTQVYRLLEQPRVLGNRRYVRGANYTKRYDHARIARMIKDQALIDRETGELRAARDAVNAALHMALQIYTSDSTPAKQNALRRLLGIGDVIEENVATDVKTGTTIHVYDLDPREEEQ